MLKGRARMLNGCTGDLFTRCVRGAGETAIRDLAIESPFLPKKGGHSGPQLRPRRVGQKRGRLRGWIGTTGRPAITGAAATGLAPGWTNSIRMVC